MSKLDDPSLPVLDEPGTQSPAVNQTKRRRITVTLTPRAADLVARYQAENKVSKTRAIEELILLNL